MDGRGKRMWWIVVKRQCVVDRGKRSVVNSGKQCVVGR